MSTADSTVGQRMAETPWARAEEHEEWAAMGTPPEPRGPGEQEALVLNRGAAQSSSHAPRPPAVRRRMGQVGMGRAWEEAAGQEASDGTRREEGAGGRGKGEQWVGPE